MATRRRAFLGKTAAAAAALGGLAVPVAAQNPGAWAPAREAQDDWLDKIPGRHRIYFDAVMPAGAAEVHLFVSNYYTGNRSAYSIESKDLAVVIGLRHYATPFAFNDAVWEKYGPTIGDMLKITDPKTSQAPVRNIYRPQYEELILQGAHLAVCDNATTTFTRMLARRMSGDAQAIYKEFVAGVLGSSHMVPAGIIAVNRAQERGYSLAFLG